MSEIVACMLPVYLSTSGRMIDVMPPIFIVMVLYQRMGAGSLSLASFPRALNEPGMLSRFKLLIYDNSPTPSMSPDSIQIPFSYIHDPANGGLYQAYSVALELAEKEGSEWMLLLDQDTLIDANYLKMLVSCLPEKAKVLRCAALVPKLLSKDQTISPARVLWGGRRLPVDIKFSGCPPWEITAFNSGTLLRISAVREIGGFNPIFWLDYLDHWLFNQLYRTGFSVHVLDIAITHELSVQSMGDMQVSRYENILLAEGVFYKCCKSKTENIFYNFRLIMRALKMIIMPVRRKLFLPTLRHLAECIGQKTPHRIQGQ